MKKIVFATGNEDKVREIGEMVGGRIEVVTMKSIGFDEEIEENGTTFMDNSAIKAKAVAEYIKANCPELSDAIVLADDSGLEIDYYDKAPGVYSHRWLGDKTYTEKMEEVLSDMKDVPDDKRACRFVCSMSAVVLPDTLLQVQDTVEGFVGHEIIGDNGFGYDPFFYMPEYGCTTAQMSPEDKNAISHRGKALRHILADLEPYFGL